MIYFLSMSASVDTGLVFDASQLHLHFGQVQYYSYLQIIEHLWNENNVVELAPYANIKFHVVAQSRLFACIVVFFSGIWPHVKLIVRSDIDVGIGIGIGIGTWHLYW